MFEKYRDSIKRVVTLAKIRRAREAFHYLTLMGNFQTFIVTCLCFIFLVKAQRFPVFCVRFLRVAAVT